MTESQDIVLNLGGGWKFQMRCYGGNLYHAYSRRDPADSWVAKTRQSLYGLFDAPPYSSSRAVLHCINAGSKKLLIIPNELGDQNAYTIATSPKDSTPVKEVQYSNCQTTPYDPATPASWNRCAADPSKPLGTGLGSDVIVQFRSEDYGVYRGPGSQSDEGLLHELVHAMRIMNGVFNGLPVRAVSADQMYGSIEEFIAILVTNIYRSENKRTGLRADHGGYRELPQPLTDSQTFYRTWKPEIDQLHSQMLRWNLFKELAQVQCRFNPLYYSEYNPQGSGPAT